MRIETKYGPILLDEQDAHFLELGILHAHPSSGNRVYLLKHDYINGKRYQRKLNLARLIMGLPLKDRQQVVDHIDHNPMNCQRYNMRVCSDMQNSQNRLRNRNGSSKFKGVCFKGSRSLPWMAQIQVNKEKRYLGNFATEHEAALAYDIAAARHFKEFAVLNNVQGAAAQIRPR